MDEASRVPGVLYSSEGQIQATCFQLLHAAKVAMVGQIGRRMGDGPSLGGVTTDATSIVRRAKDVTNGR